MQRLCQRASVAQVVVFLAAKIWRSRPVGEYRHQAGDFANSLRRTAAAVLGLGLLALTACEPAETAVPAPVGDLHDTMTWFLDPAADVIWNSAGFVLTAEGETPLAPTTDEGWARVRHSAVVVAEGGNLLLLPHMLPDASEDIGTDAWVEFSHGMTRIGMEAIAAVDAQDADALFTVGGHLYNVCLACHQVYAREMEEDGSA